MIDKPSPRDELADLIDETLERRSSNPDSIQAWDQDEDLLPLADAILAAGWRPPLPLLGPLRRDQAVPDGWYPAAMREHDRANAAELDRTAAARRAASWWEAAKTLNRWGTAHREAHRAALVEITNLTAVRGELAHQRNDHRARADAAEAKLRQVREVITEDAETRARFNVDTSTSYGPRFLNRIRAIVERESATRCVNDTNGDGDCAACAHNPNAPCRSASEEPTCACDRPVARCSCRIADLCKAAADKLDTEETTP